MKNCIYFGTNKSDILKQNVKVYKKKIVIKHLINLLKIDCNMDILRKIMCFPLLPF